MLPINSHLLGKISTPAHEARGDEWPLLYNNPDFGSFERAMIRSHCTPYEALYRRQCLRFKREYHESRAETIRATESICISCSVTPHSVPKRLLHLRRFNEFDGEPTEPFLISIKILLAGKLIKFGAPDWHYFALR